jgi:hypothetical protein
VDKRVKEGTGFDVSAEFDPLWFAKARKAATGGYLDNLMATPTSFEELLKILRN